MRLKTFLLVVGSTLALAILMVALGFAMGWSRTDASSPVCLVYAQEAVIEADVVGAIDDLAAANEQADPILFDMKLTDVQYLTQEALDLYAVLDIDGQDDWLYFVYMRYTLLDDAFYGMRQGRDITALAMATAYYEMLADEIATQADCFAGYQAD